MCLEIYMKNFSNVSITSNNFRCQQGDNIMKFLFGHLREICMCREREKKFLVNKLSSKRRRRERRKQHSPAYRGHRPIYIYGRCMYTNLPPSFFPSTFLIRTNQLMKFVSHFIGKQSMDKNEDDARDRQKNVIFFVLSFVILIGAY